MLHLSRRLGNIHTTLELLRQTTQWQDEGRLDEVTVEEREARKSRLRLSTLQGRDVGLQLPRGTELQDGDVFALEEDGGGVLIRIALQEVMVLTPRSTLGTQERWAWAIRLGHVLGNQHWPIAVEGEQILTPVAVDRAVMETVLNTHHLTQYFSIHYERRSWPREESHHPWTTPRS